MANFEEYKELLEENAPSECQACGGPLVLEKVNLEDYQGGKLFMMEKVPAFVCQNCGEIWVPEPVMLEFERMIETVKLKKQEKNVKKKTPVKKHKEKKKNIREEH
ncbi:MAG: YgiT-type zinc finger protein [Candidatus Margulisbacteria bacterium]|nr:YgiT-type zinc finger protein [Candidatus Margulisiibacteriota bacterium]